MYECTHRGSHQSFADSTKTDNRVCTNHMISKMGRLRADGLREKWVFLLYLARCFELGIFFVGFRKILYFLCLVGKFDFFFVCAYFENLFSDF